MKDRLKHPKNLRLSRPYASVEDYVAAEGWTIDARGMVLLEQESMPPGTVVRFEIVLESGEKPIRAEARVVGDVEPTGSRPGGVRVRFRRLGPNCKELLDHVLESRGSSAHATVELSSPMAAELPLPDPEPTPPPSPAPQPERSSEVRVHGAGPIAAPPNRDELLERLRERARRQR
jgi:hypothetical protein